MKWVDTLDIAIELSEKHTDVDRNMFVLLICIDG